MNQALYAHMNNKRKRKKKVSGFIIIFRPKDDGSKSSSWKAHL
jgi:hypothetical protein